MLQDFRKCKILTPYCTHTTNRQYEKRKNVFVPKMDNDVVHRIVKLNLHWLSLVRSTISERPAIALSLKR